MTTGANMTKPASTCARCGLEADAADLTPFGVCAGPAVAQFMCRDRELLALRSLLRSVTGKLENAREHLDGPTDALQMFKAAAEVDAVLELLS
jgi:hypothetical protein